MSERMLVTQALDERDLLVKKIADKIEKASFVDTIKPNEDKVYVKRSSKEEYAKDAESAYQQIMDLIDRFFFPVRWQRLPSEKQRPGTGGEISGKNSLRRIE